jgi:tRNA A37 threonylcarbamoyladenosine dehydratase
MTNLAKLISLRRASEGHGYKPRFFRLHTLRAREEIVALFRSDPGIETHDQIVGQLEELIKIKNPALKFTLEELQVAIKLHLNGQELQNYGVWVFYPWLRKIVHMLDEEEFVEVRTNRNMYKITPAERTTLASKAIGVVGLSVGHSIALTLAQERLATEFRLADFDELELSNLNRIRTGVANLGCEKTEIVAREIVEIDPFIKVNLWNKGLTEENVDEFFTKGGKLDLIFDECDSIDVKVLLREVAKREGVPVVMDTSDRGMIDIERFDLEPDRPIFHGLAGELDYSLLKELKTSEEKIPYVLPIVGVETMSKRLKASMMEIGESVSTWPQLASAVNYGGGISADIARRILLGQIDKSDRYFFDPANLVAPEKVTPPSPARAWHTKPYAPFTPERAKELARPHATPSGKNEVAVEEIEELLEAAVLAPSGGNMQPWYWYYDLNRLFLFLDRHQSYSLLDFEHRGSYLALGAAIENLSLAAKNRKLELRIQTFPDAGNDELVAILDIKRNEDIALAEGEVGLLKSIGYRQTNRILGAREEVDANLISQLVAIGEGTEFCISEVSDLERIRHVADLIADGEKVRLMHEWGHHDFQNEIRWNEAENQATKNGVDIETVDLTPSDIAGLKIVSDWHSVAELRSIGEEKGAKFRDLALKTFDSTSVLLLLSSKNDDPRQYLEMGKVAERLWLKATSLKLAAQPVGAPLFLAARGAAEPKTYTEYQLKILKNLLTQMPAIFDVAGQNPLFLLRIHKADYAKRALRKPLEQVFAYEGEDWIGQDERKEETASSDVKPKFK